MLKVTLGTIKGHGEKDKPPSMIDVRVDSAYEGSEGVGRLFEGGMAEHSTELMDHSWEESNYFGLVRL